MRDEAESKFRPFYEEVKMIALVLNVDERSPRICGIQRHRKSQSQRLLRR